MCKNSVMTMTASAIATIALALLASQSFGASTTYSLAAVGDIMLGTNYPVESLPGRDGTDVLGEAAALLKAATVSSGNLEGTLLDGGGTPKRCANPSSCHVFRMPERYASLLSDAGIDHVSMANNHSGDFGPAGRRSTLAALKSVGVVSTGIAGVNETAVIVRGGVRYGFASFSISSGTLSATDYVKAAAVIRQLDSAADIVVVNMHVGAEGAKYSHVSRAREHFLGEDRGNPYEFARVAIDAGADIVIGHGPHVPRALDLYKGRFVAYSLGNFATTTGVSIAGKSGYAPLVVVNTDKEGRFVGGHLYSFIQSGPNGNRRPHADSSLACIKEMRQLTEVDRLGDRLVIGEDGSLAVNRQ